MRSNWVFSIGVGHADFRVYRQDINTCQDAGKIVLLSLGGAVGDYGFSSSSEAETFAAMLWDIFGEGTSSTRPFDSSTVDGFDLGFSFLKSYFANFFRY